MRPRQPRQPASERRKGKGRGGRDASQKATIGNGKGMGGRGASQKANEIISEASKRVPTLLTNEDFVSKSIATHFQEQRRKSLLPGQPRQRTTASLQETPCYGPTTIAKDAETFLRPIFEAVRNKMPGCTFKNSCVRRTRASTRGLGSTLDVA